MIYRINSLPDEIKKNVMYYIQVIRLSNLSLTSINLNKKNVSYLKIL